MILARSCRAPDNDERIRQYDDRLRRHGDFHPREHAWRVAKGVKVQAEVVRFPIPRHKSLVVIPQKKRARRAKGAK